MVDGVAVVLDQEVPGLGDVSVQPQRPVGGTGVHLAAAAPGPGASTGPVALHVQVVTDPRVVSPVKDGDGLKVSTRINLVKSHVADVNLHLILSRSMLFIIDKILSVTKVTLHSPEVYSIH